MHVGAVGSAPAIAVSGLRDATVRLDVAAHNVANASTEGFRPLQALSVEAPGGGVDTLVTRTSLEGVDLVSELVAAMMAESAFVASAKMLEQAHRLHRVAIDLVA